MVCCIGTVCCGRFCLLICLLFLSGVFVVAMPMPTRLGRGFLWFCRTHIAGAIAIDKTHCILSHFGVLWLHAFLDACLGSVCHWLVLTHSSHKRVFVEMKKNENENEKRKGGKK